MATLSRVTASHAPISEYRDQKWAVSNHCVRRPPTSPCLPQGSRESREEQMKKSTTLYVGNLSFYTTEDQACFARTRRAEIRVLVGFGAPS